MTTETQDPRVGLPSASDMGRLYFCPGSRSAEKGLPDRKPLEVTDSGTAIHEAQARGDDSDLDLSEKEINARITAIEKIAISEWTEECGGGNKPTIEREARYWIRNAALDPIASAQVDLLCEVNGHALVIDTKTGYIDAPPSEKNWQLRTQVIAAKYEYPHITHFRAAILASRLYDKFDATDYTPSDVKNVEREVLHIIWRSEQPDAPRVPGPHCRWCKALGVCKEAAVYSTISEAVVGPAANSLDIVRSVSQMRPQELAFVLKKKSLASAFFDAVYERLKSLPAEELAAVGFKLADGVSIIKFTNTSAALARLLNVLRPEQVDQCLKISIPSAAKLVAKEKGIAEKKGREVVETVLGDSFKKELGQPRLREI